jgi:ribosome-binding factor A
MKEQLLLIANIFLTLAIITAANKQNFAQDAPSEPLNSEWVKNDLQGVTALLRLIPIENQDVEFLKKTLKGSWSIEDEPLGFGANRVTLSKGYGYSSVYVDVLTHQNHVAYYEIGVNGSSEKWKEYREQIINAWRAQGGPEFTEEGARLRYEKKYERVFDYYFRVVANDLGEMKVLSVPADLKNAYDYLTSPFNNSYVGQGACGYGGSVLEGKTAIDALIKGKRIDLIQNVLRGYNPGGRVFAAIALVRMNQQGLQLDAETLATLNRVLSLDVPISTCAGCIVSTGQRTKDIVAQFAKP